MSSRRNTARQSICDRVTTCAFKALGKKTPIDAIFSIRTVRARLTQQAHESRHIGAPFSVLVRVLLQQLQLGWKRFRDRAVGVLAPWTDEPPSTGNFRIGPPHATIETISQYNMDMVIENREIVDIDGQGRSEFRQAGPQGTDPMTINRGHTPADDRLIPGSQLDEETSMRPCI